ncbi:MAG TPA: 1-(5-phosphoribosyl)-5-[(5-phosphoribosylamino)methylideneamino]imidazole-4-carboxamide isomerase [Planctomycetota bacterium]|nr:1-(5-phosphoribosyl)-5-[(5-phosphoribosylamino)methylideneamino]imidazole-4-carboxamide isomerase [Planctomycetota bacterium]
MLVIPAVDIKGGKCVRLRQGRAEEETVFGEDPVGMARHWEEEGAGYLHVVDLDGAFEGTPINLELVKSIVRGVGIPVEIGGGLRTERAVAELLELGADRVVLGTSAVESVEWVSDLARGYPGRVAVGIDTRRGMVATHGWVKTTEVTPIELVKLLGDAPVAAYIYTDVLRDGTKTGPNVRAIQRFAHATHVPVIGSGGVSSLEDLRALARIGLHAAIVGRALYDGLFTLADAVKAAV